MIRAKYLAIGELEQVSDHVYAYVGDITQPDTDIEEDSPWGLRVKSPSTRGTFLAVEISKGRLSQAASCFRGIPRPSRIGDFICEREIGAGAFSQVMMATHSKSQTSYAIKTISKRTLRRKKIAQKDWRLERDILVKMEPHPYVTELICSFQTAGHFFLVMAYLPGGELFNVLRRHGTFAQDVTAFYSAEVTLALEHLHASGIIHRDLKPENLLMARDFHVVVTDFGLAKQFESEEDRHRTLCGTDIYMAPEMLARRSYGKPVDYWSLGVLIYEMLAGVPPFAHREIKELHRKILTEKVRWPQFFGPDAISVLRGLLERQVPRRLGASKATMFEVGGVAALKSHMFFGRIEWQPLLRRESPAPLNSNEYLEQHTIQGECCSSELRPTFFFSGGQICGPGPIGSKF